MTTIDTTEIKFDRVTKDFAIIIEGRVIGYGRNYSEAEIKRTAYLAAAHNTTCATCGGEGDCPDCNTVMQGVA